MHETAQAFGHRTDVTAGQFARAYAVDHIMAVRAPVEVMAEPSYFNLGQNDVLLVVIFVPTACAEVVAAALRTLGKLDVHMLVKVIRYGAGFAGVSSGRAAFLG